ncbi:tyrosine-type recombinase/integrase [Paeniglutamicibacter sp. NPDC012692]|uniref:tyrosine-type recombinase/integrase n=1 Tax=Paeniglutamicibacter sp. NPDC012692 TaxID=3364388 RepID=UPI0036897D5A
MATGRINDTWLLKDRKTRSKRYGIGKRWQAVWTDGHGHEEKKSFELKDAAKAWIDNKTASNLRDPRGIKPDIPFLAYYEEWRANQIHQRANSLSTLDSHVKNWILPAFKDRTIQKIGRQEVQGAVTWWDAKGNAASTVALMYTYLRGIMSDAVFDKRIAETPCVRIRLPEQVRATVQPMTLDQIQAMHRQMRGPWRDGLMLAAASGLRPGEWRGLTVDSVDLQLGLLRITHQVATHAVSAPKLGPLKTPFSYREIGIGPEAVEILRPLVEAPGVLGLLFHDGGTILTAARAAREWSRVRKVLPWMGSGWHQVRHFHASRLIAGGASPVAVAHRLGHKDATETLRTYSHLWPDDDAKMAAMSDVGDLLSEV